MNLIGRTEVLQRLALTQSPLIILTGDAGIGKSRVLEELATLSQDNFIYPKLRRAQPYDGSLQTILLEEIADACAIVDRKQPISDRIVNTFTTAIQRMTTASAREIGRIAVDQIFSLIAARIGDEGAAILRAAVSSLTTANEDALASRIRKSADLDVVRTLVSLAEEAKSIIGSVRFRIDTGERLTDPDFQLLTGLPDLLTDGMTIFVSHSVTGQDDVNRIRLARVRGAAEVQVPPLSLGDVREWLTEAGIDLANLHQVWRVSDGYPLVIDTAVQQLINGQTLEDLPVIDAFQAMTERAWSTLDATTSTHARRLVPFTDPPAAAQIAALLNMTLIEWSGVRDRLLEARIFSVTVDGSPWFHERRRLLLWEKIFSEDDRHVIAEEVSQPLVDWINEGDSYDTSLSLALADLAPLAESLRSAVPSIQVALDLTRLELGQVFALLELMESDSGISTSMIIDYARRILHLTGDAVAAIERLNQNRVLLSVTAGDNSVSILTSPNRETTAVLLGRCVREFGRIPLGRAATSVFEVSIRPRMGSFLTARYGIGRPRLGNDYRNFTESGGRPTYPPALSLRGTHGARPFYLTASFADEGLRVHAREQVAEVDEYIFGEHLVITEVFELPSRRIPPLRFIRAYQELTSNDVSAFVSSGVVPRVHRASLLDIANIRSAARIYMAGRMSTLERGATQLDRKVRTVVAQDDKGYHAMIDIDTDGSDESVTTVHLAGTQSDALLFARLSQDLELGHEEYISHVHISVDDTGYEDPVLAAFKLSRQRAKEFNSTQPVLVLPGSQDSLQEMLSDGLHQRHKDTLALLRSGIQIPKLRMYRPRRYHLLLYPSLARLRRNALFASYIYARSSAPGIEIEILNEAVDGDPEPDDLCRLFGVDPTVVKGRGVSTIDLIAADFLGYERDDVRAAYRFQGPAGPVPSA